jgi:hypothetical protein
MVVSPLQMVMTIFPTETRTLSVTSLGHLLSETPALLAGVSR